MSKNLSNRYMAKMIVADYSIFKNKNKKKKNPTLPVRTICCGEVTLFVNLNSHRDYFRGKLSTKT